MVSLPFKVARPGGEIFLTFERKADARAKDGGHAPRLPRRNAQHVR